MLTQIPLAPPDPILGLGDAYRADPSPRKINLGVGVYQDDSGKTPVLECVKEAERRLVREARSKTYLPISGSPAYAAQVQNLIAGDAHPAVESGRARTLQTPGGTAALRVGAELIRRFFPNSTAWVSHPTWANHRGVFGAAGFPVKDYPYYDAAGRQVAFEALCEALRKVPAGDLVVLHVCCHNPTGADLSEEQWGTVAGIAAERGWLPFLDFAYQGLGEGVEPDRTGLRVCLERVPELLVASSFSKNFGLYSERVGALTLVARDARAAEWTFSQAKAVARVQYSNPPAHGALIVETILGDADLARLWRRELDAMRARIVQVRAALVEGLRQRAVAGDFAFITAGRGMFSLTGWTDAQLEFLRAQRSIYVVGGGRLNMAGITSRNLDYLCDSLSEALTP